MSVYVDEMFDTIPTNRWPWKRACHLFADTQAELHEFAASAGLKRCWFQYRDEHLPHYDLTADRRDQAIRHGAIALDRRAAVAKWREIEAADRSETP